VTWAIEHCDPKAGVDEWCNECSELAPAAGPSVDEQDDGPNTPRPNGYILLSNGDIEVGVRLF
jgi:hypothetical protein